MDEELVYTEGYNEGYRTALQVIRQKILCLNVYHDVTPGVFSKDYIPVEWFRETIDGMLDNDW